MKIGDRVNRYITTACTAIRGMLSSPEERKIHTGTVVYIHPQNRYYTVEFLIDDVAIRENYNAETEI